MSFEISQRVTSHKFDRGVKQLIHHQSTYILISSSTSRLLRKGQPAYSVRSYFLPFTRTAGLILSNVHYTTLTLVPNTSISLHILSHLEERRLLALKIKLSYLLFFTCCIIMKKDTSVINKRYKCCNLDTALETYLHNKYFLFMDLRDHIRFMVTSKE